MAKPQRVRKVCLMCMYLLINLFMLCTSIYLFVHFNVPPTSIVYPIVNQVTGEYEDVCVDVENCGDGFDQHLDITDSPCEYPCVSLVISALHLTVIAFFSWPLLYLIAATGVAISLCFCCGRFDIYRWSLRGMTIFDGKPFFSEPCRFWRSDNAFEWTLRLVLFLDSLVEIPLFLVGGLELAAFICAAIVNDCAASFGKGSSMCQFLDVVNKMSPFFFSLVIFDLVTVTAVFVLRVTALARTQPVEDDLEQDSSYAMYEKTVEGLEPELSLVSSDIPLEHLNQYPEHSDLRSEYEG
uniref:Uncharacterized protein n=1 Tax=Rhodosorus marinus TaxID=101924 RepID=A0A7S2ZLU1_9RHOD|mmetsp:Transcript_22794/g.91282  ORF Transcript_22794/g.91282 Transcript_22794/m.91282 type:complete len:296 (+) Transcript_22794:400-1287(+)